MRWFVGSITDAITTAKQRNVLFVVYVRGDDDASTQMDTTWEDQEISQLCEDSGMVAVKFNADSDEFKQFSQYYPVKCVPCVSFISGSTGEPIEGTDGYINSSEFKQRIQKVLERTKQASSTTPSTRAPASTSSPATVASDSSTSPQTSTVSQASPTLQASATAASQDQKKELSKLEKAARLRQKMEEIHQRKEAEKEEELKKKEIDRRKVGQAVQKSMQERSDQEARRVAQELRKEKEEERLAKERVREQIARDRAEKQSRYESNKREREKSQVAAQEAAQAANQAPKRKINMLKGRKRKKTPKRLQRFQSGKIYICPQCLKEYIAKGSLRRHLKIEHGPKVFSWCRRCEYQCNRRDNLRRHYIQYHTEYVRDLETIAFETLEQRNHRVRLEIAEKRLATSKAKGSQKRKTGTKTWNVRKSFRRDSSAATSCVNLIGNERTPSGSMTQQSLHEDSQENLGGTYKQVKWAPVKMEPEEMLLLPSSLIPSSSSLGPASKNPVSSPLWADMTRQQHKYWTGCAYQCPECIMTFQHSSSLFQHLQKEHGGMPLFFCQHCSFRSKGMDNMRKHYYKIHPLHQEDVDVITSESILQTEIREQQETLGGIERVADHGQGSSQSLLCGHNNSSFYFKMPETVNQLTGPGSGLCPDASNIHVHTEQLADAIMASSTDGLPVPGIPFLQQDSSLPTEQTTKDSCLTISQEAISDVGHVFPVGEEESSYCAISQPIYDSDNSASDINMTCSSEPVHTLGDIQHAIEWSPPKGKEAGGCFKCPKCSREYLQLGSLNRHLRLDHGPPTCFWCRHCEFRTNRKDNFKRHYKQSHPQNIEEVKAINVETSEEKENRERQEEMKNRQSPRSRGSIRGSGQGMRDVGKDETHLQRIESVSTSSVAKNMEEHLSTQTNELCQERATSQSISSKSSVLSPRVQLVKMFYPEHIKSSNVAAPTCCEHAGTDSASESCNNSPQSKTSDTIMQESQNPLQGMTTSNATKTSHSIRHSKRKSQHITRSLAESILPLSHEKKSYNKVKDLPVYTPEEETSNKRFGFINSLQHKVMDGSVNNLPTCTPQRNVTCNTSHTVVKSPHTSTYINSDERLEALSPPTINMTKNVAQDCSNAQQSISNLPQINTHNTGYELPTINVTNNAARDLHNSHQSETVDNTRHNSQTLQQQNAACIDLPGLVGSARGSSANNVVQEESPVTSTSEGPCIPLTRLEEVLRGNVTKVIEESHTVIYKDGTRIREETVKRTYEVIFQADFGNGTVKPC
ncbi:uncharacterized protein LOC119719922 isoform X1 [Patiria miniata]|uniref:C2H2-type domain-containing protein n=1 Tax=Patiria miniata TaxID=46514 RepID=A0A913Z076_PATMI|nr:uncharacterized protein LOC119719922 isoform X1 [Patiria miniata]